MQGLGHSAKARDAGIECHLFCPENYSRRATQE